jgi:hypothetical protein
MATFASRIHPSGYHSPSHTPPYNQAYDEPPIPSYTLPHTSSSHSSLAHPYAHSPDEMPGTPLGRSNSGEHGATTPGGQQVQFAEQLPPSRGSTMDGAIPLHSSLDISVPSTVFVRGAGGDYEPCLLMVRHLVPGYMRLSQYHKWHIC